MARLRPRPRRPLEHRKERIARQHARAYKRNNPEATDQQVCEAVKAELMEDYPGDFGIDFDWESLFAVLIEFLKAWLNFSGDE